MQECEIHNFICAFASVHWVGLFSGNKGNVWEGLCEHILLKTFNMTAQEKLKYNYWCTIKCTGFWNAGIAFLPNVHAFMQEILTTPITLIRYKVESCNADGM